jgi:phosphoribosylamine--glycine ligase
MSKTYKTLIIGSGGREHAILLECLKSPFASKVIAAPGNGGMEMDAQCFPVDVSDPLAIANLAKREGVEFAIVGPEVPLCAGAVDALEAAGILAFGPNKKAARFEASKTYTKDFLAKYNIPTARYGNFTETALALAFLEGFAEDKPVVIKASGLAAGKGVIIAQNREEAVAAVKGMLEEKQFGESGESIVIEEYLTGRETSLHLLVSGQQFVTLPTSRDHKKIGDGDTGPNTGGMGVIAPDPTIPDDILQGILQNIAKPTLSGIEAEGIDYRGILYIGLMLTEDGPKVLEFNVRLGDPETQLILPLFQEDTMETFLAAAKGEKLPAALTPTGESAITVVLAAEGYPGNYPKGLPIQLPQDYPEDTYLIHAGTSTKENRLVTSGGRVLNIIAIAEDAETAYKNAYKACGHPFFDNQYYRKDIGKTVPTN